MRDSTRTLVVILLAATMRAVLTKDPGQFALVIIALAFHESYRKMGGVLGDTNFLYILLWVYNPKLYVLWLVLWEIGMSQVSSRKKVISRRKEGEKAGILVEHRATRIPAHIAQHSLWNFGLIFKLQVLGTNLELEYIGNITPEDPIMDENFILQNMGDVSKNSSEAWEASRNIMMITSIIMGALIGSHIGLIVGCIVAGAIYVAKPRSRDDREGMETSPLKVSKGSPLPKSDGIYRITAKILDYQYHVGVGYITSGVLHTRYHVTHANPIEIEESLHYPTYINMDKDGVAYGGRPKTVGVAMREEIVVAVAGPHSNYILPYKTRAETDSNGNLIFYGNRSMPGCSGSPIFRLVSVIERGDDGTDHISTRYAFIGTIGWFYDKQIANEENGTIDERKAVEIVPTDPMSSDYHYKFRKNDVNQIFKYPGSGKTRTTTVDLMVDGKMTYGKVYFTGPTRTVCEEAYSALSNRFSGEVSLLTSTANTYERGSSHRPIIITAHATALNMIARGSTEIVKKGLWIMDEAHFIDSKSLVLKDCLRHKTTKEHAGTLVEMTATGYNIKSGTYIAAEGSNSPIQDVVMSPEEMVNEIALLSRTRKVMVFVTGLLGRSSTTAASLTNKIERSGGVCVTLSRDTFNTRYKQAKKMSVGAILTTDISECGANLNPDIVFDFQTTSKIIAVGKNAVLERRVIDKGQMIQRRGRVGRNPNPAYPATYVSPGLDLPDYDLARIEHHERVAAAKALGYDILDPIPESCALDDITLTADQIGYWASTDEGGANSLRMVHMTTNHKGLPLSAHELEHRIDEWIEANDVTVRVGDQTIECGWWDHRDSQILLKILCKRGIIKGSLTTTDRLMSITQMLLKMLSRGKPPNAEGTGLRGISELVHDERDEDHNYYEHDEEDHDEACDME